MISDRIYSSTDSVLLFTKELCGRNIRVSHAVKQVEREPGRGRRGGGGGRGRGGRGRGLGFRRNNKPYSDPRMGRDMDRGRPRADGSSLDYGGYNKYGGESERPPYSRERGDSASYQPDYRNPPASGGYSASMPYKDDKYGASHPSSRGGYGSSMPYKDDKYSASQPPSRGGYSQRRGSGGHRGGYRSNMPSGGYNFDESGAQSQSTGMYPQRSSEGYQRRDQNAAAEVPSTGGGSYRGNWKDSYGNRGDRMGRANTTTPSYQVRSDYSY